MRLRRRLDRSACLQPAIQHCNLARLWAPCPPPPNVLYPLSSQRRRTSLGPHLLLALLLPPLPLSLFIRPPILACRLLIRLPPNCIIIQMRCRAALIILRMRNPCTNHCKCPQRLAGLQLLCSPHLLSSTTLFHPIPYLCLLTHWGPV